MATIQSVRDRIRTAIAHGDYDQGLSLVRLIQSHFPKDFETLELLGQIYLENGRSEAARETFEAVLGIDPENVLSRSALAVIAEEEGHPEEALLQFERAFDINTSNRSVAEEIQRLHAQLGHSRPREPGSSIYARARRLLRDERYDAAVSVFEDAQRVEPEAIEVALGRAQALWLADRSKKAEAAVRETLAEHPHCLKALAILAGVVLARRSDEALKLLSSAAALNPGNLVARGLFEKAGLPFPIESQPVEIPDLEEQEPAPAAPETLEEPGLVAVPESEAPDAAPEAIAAPPVGSVAAEENGNISSEGEGFSSSAAAAASEAVSTEPSVPTLEQPLEEIPLPMDEAESQWARRRSKVEDPSTDKQRQGHAALHLSFGRSFESKGQVELALSEYHKALQVHPSTASAVGDATLAMAAADPANLRARWLAGDALATTGQFRRAVEQYLIVLKSAGETSPDGGEALLKDKDNS